MIGPVRLEPDAENVCAADAIPDEVAKPVRLEAETLSSGAPAAVTVPVRVTVLLTAFVVESVTSPEMVPIVADAEIRA